jgi:hypothetical protein
MFDFGLLSNAALTGLSDAEKSDLQKQATTQFLLGSLLSNDPSLGLKSALGVPEQYTSAQRSISDAAEKRRQRDEVSNFLEQYAPTPMQAGQRALGAEGRGPTNAAAQNQQAILNTPINYQQALTDSLRLAGNPGQAQIRETLTAMQPKFQGDLRVDASGKIVGSLPTTKDGIQSQFNPQTGTYSANPVQNYMLSQILTQRPETSANTMLGVNPDGSIRQMAIPGAAQAVGEIEGAKALAGAQGQLERIVNPDGTERFVSRASLLGQPSSRISGGQPMQGGTTQGVTGATGGNIAKISPDQETINAAVRERFTTFSNASLAGAQSAGGRKLAAEDLYNLSTRIQNNKLTGLQAGAYGYLNAIPGVGKLFEQDVVDVTRMNQQIAAAQLEKTAQQKGAASNLDAQVIARGYATLTDPAAATRLLAVQEIALADKDIARNQFVESYTGNPSQIATAWGNSPTNQPIFTHPKFNQFLTEQVNAWDQGGRKNAPVLPAGFQFGTSKRTGQFIVKRPDGSTYTIGQ